MRNPFVSDGARKIAIEGLLVGLSIWIGVIEHQFSFMGVQVFQGFSLIPILFLQDLFGLKSSFLCLFSSSLMRSIFFSQAGILGFLIKISSFIYMCFRKNCAQKFQNMLFDIIGIICTIIAKIPLSYFLWKSIMKISQENLINGIIKYMIPINLIRLSAIVLISRIVKINKYIK